MLRHLIISFASLWLLLPAWVEARNPFQPTVNIHRQNGQYTAERADIHREIVGRIAGQGRSSPQPILLVVSGAPGAGKSTLVKEMGRLGIIDTAHFLNVNADSLKKELPEYESMRRRDRVSDDKITSLYLHEESVDLRMQLFNEALYLHKNMIFETTLTDRQGVHSAMQGIRRDYPDYTIVMMHVDADLQTHLRRTRQRARDGGRYVSDERVRSDYQKSVVVFENLRADADLSLVMRSQQWGFSITSTGQGGRILPWQMLSLSHWRGVAGELAYHKAGQNLRRLISEPGVWIESACRVMLRQASQTRQSAPAFSISN